MQTGNQEQDVFSFNAIGVVRSGFQEKFAVPRQPGLMKSMESEVEIFPSYAKAEAFRELSGFSHIWLLFVFHHCLDQSWHSTVRPPRLGGNARVGVFASRSPFRPNPIGLSAVELIAIETRGDKLYLRIRGADLVDGTPVLDIKPYIPYADAIDASPGYAPPPLASLEVKFTEQASIQVAAAEKRLGQPVGQIVREMLVLDPRPAYREDDDNTYGVRLFDFDLRFRVDGVVVTVIELSASVDH